MGQLTDSFIDAVLLFKRAATQQAGIISGDNPTDYNASDPLRLWVIQVGIIVCFTQLLSLLLQRIRQPRVIAEVIGGVLLGPSVMGHVPNFRSRIFPQQSIPLLTLTANIGLVFFLFLVGLEIDTRVIRRNARKSLAISAAGLILPFGLGAALAVPLYHEFINPSVNYGYFILFVAVAIGITAFPVLCRILTETGLLDTTVGVVTLSAGVGNDVVGWILLALTVALVNASTGLTALYVLLAAVGYVLFLLYPVRIALRWLAHKTGSLESGRPSRLMMTVTLLLVLVSAFFTDIIGIHAIFGGFVAGLIIPHENGFAISVVEKLEDIITIVFLPLYFVLSGLNTNLGLLDTGKTWGYIVLICTVAFFGKFLGCFITAKALGFNLRESGAIGSLMSCKGLVELIVLNVGLQAGVLDARTFSMFVLHAIVLTFMTTPLTLLWYPVKYRTSAFKQVSTVNLETTPGPAFDVSSKNTFAVVLNRLDHVPAFMSLMQLVQRPPSISSTDSLGHALSTVPSLAGNEKAGSSDLRKSSEKARSTDEPVELSALRLIELTERTSDVLKSQEASALVHVDPLLNLARACARPFRVRLNSTLAVLPVNEFSNRVLAHVRESASQLLVLPWSINTFAPDDAAPPSPNSPVPGSGAPVETALGGLPASSASGLTSANYSQFVRKIFAESQSDVAIFIDRLAPSDTKTTHIFAPFFGGPDDRLALEFVVQLCMNPALSATIVWIRKSAEGDDAQQLEPADSIDEAKAQALREFTLSGTGGIDTVYGAHNTQTRMQSETADNLLWARYATASAQTKLPAHLQEALSRVTFREVGSPSPLHTMLTYVAPGGLVPAASELLFVAGRGRRMAAESHTQELKAIAVEHGRPASVISDLSKTLGDVATAVVAAGHQASIFVMQAADRGSSA